MLLIGFDIVLIFSYNGIIRKAIFQLVKLVDACTEIFSIN